jgi:hypothetical protein
MMQLGPDVDPDEVTTAFKNGVLTITVAKRPEAQRPVNASRSTRDDLGTLTMQHQARLPDAASFARRGERVVIILNH